MKNFIVYFLITFLNAINFSEDISSIIYNNCTSCHRVSEIGAFLPLENYQDVYNNRSLIAYAIGADDDLRHGNPMMPPWPPDREFSTLLDERYLGDNEIDLIVSWIENGAIQGDPNLEYPMPNFPDGSTLGQPDLVFEMEESHFIEGNYEDDYRCFVFSLENEEEIELSAIEFRPGNREAVHHAIITYVPHGEADHLENSDNQYGYECYGGFNLSTATDLIGGYAPGLSSVEYPENIGRTIPQNSDILVQVHYAPLLTDQEDLSSINLFYKEENIEREINQYIFDFWEFALPPNQVTSITRNLYIENDISMVNILPHCHLLGQSWEIFATTNENDTIPIIKIPKWDFDWQSFYYPEFLLKIPAGSTLTATCVYDNTINNPDNPNNPPQWVYPGDGTNDEMFFIPIEYLDYQTGDEDIYLGVDDQCLIFGDQNHDSYLNVLDVVILVNIILESNDYSCADLNSDSVVNILDIIILIEMILI